MEMLNCSNIFILLILNNVLFYRKILIERKCTLYEIQKFMTVQCLVGWSHVPKPDTANNLLAVTQTRDVVSRGSKSIKWQ